MGYSASSKLKDNITALEIAFNQQQGQVFTAEQLEALRRYAGFGGIKAVLFGEGSREAWSSKGAIAADMQLYDDVQRLFQLINQHVEFPKAVVESMQQSVLTSFYTPAFLPAAVFSSLKEAHIHPTAIYEPSAGVGIFMDEAIKAFPSIEKVTGVEKDYLTAMILHCITSSYPPEIACNIKFGGFEETSNEENGKFDIITSNIPFGNIRVFDPAIKDKSLSERIHNYFFVKGIDKVRDGGLLIYLTTDGFLNSPGNEKVRRYLFERTNFVSLTVLPDNLMKETGNTEAPTELLIVQKDSSKSGLSKDEELLLQTTMLENEFGEFTLNKYRADHPQLLLGDVVEDGKNQYGQAHVRLWQTGNIEQLSAPLREILARDFMKRLDKEAFKITESPLVAPVQLPVPVQGTKLFEFREMPAKKDLGANVQLGLFDAIQPENINRALDYIGRADEDIILKNSAKVVGIIRTTERPDHESVILMTARNKRNAHYLYRVISNVSGPIHTVNWMHASNFSEELQSLSGQLREYSYSYQFEGDRSLEQYLALAKERPNVLKELRAYYKEGTLVVDDRNVGIIRQIDTAAGEATYDPISVSGKSYGVYAKYVSVRSCYLALVGEQSNGGQEPEKLREKLQEEYEAFVSRYGQMNQKENRRLIERDEAWGWLMLSSLERREEEKYVTADIVTTPILEVQEALQLDSPLEALAVCLNRFGRVDIPFIASTCNQTEEDTIEHLGDKVYVNPATNRWETNDEYLSGNVVEKLSLAESVLKQHPEDIQLRRSYEAIKGSQPEKVPFELLDFNLGERWIPTEYYERYLKELLDTDVRINYFNSIDNFIVDINRPNSKCETEFRINPKSGKTMNAHTLVEHALENTTPFFTYAVEEHGGTVRKPDNDATQLAHQKIEQIRKGFVEWLSALNKEEKEKLENLYNRIFNCYVLREYDGSHLTFPGLDTKALNIETPYSSQKNATWRFLQNNGGLADHEVGLGKTLTMILTAQEMRRFGIAKKPMILALNANVGEIALTYRQAYPHARVLAPSEKDFTPKNRQRLFHEIKNNNFDCIIITHDQFMKIQQSFEVQQQIFQDELDHVELNLETAEQLGEERVSKTVLKGLEVRKNNLTARLKDIQHAMQEKKDKLITFSDMGIDHLIVDESHKFKNLTYSTRHNRVSGLGNPEGSQKALNLLFAIRTLQLERGTDLCATFLSGTPISNSLTEMYLIFKYLRPNEMRKQHIENFDAWAAVYAKKSVDYEFSVTNEIIAKERFRLFIKVPELQVFYNQIADYQTAAHINLDKPQLEEKLVNLKPSDAQIEFTDRLMQFAKTGDGTLIGRGPLSKEEDKSRMLLATNAAKKMAIDMRLIDPYRYGDDPNNKVNSCADNVFDIYQRTREHRGTQIVFCDIGTPGTKGFNLYNALLEKLVERGVPINEITFAHSWPRHKRKELFAQMNAGKICFLFGSTDKAGTGLNVQERIVAMHHLDIPWKPSELDQRNGRGARQGNQIAKAYYENKVLNFIYATERSLDNYKFNLLKTKQLFISQMRSGKMLGRTIDEGAMDEQTGVSFNEYIAILSGDTSLLEKSRLEKMIMSLEGLHGAYQREMLQHMRELTGIEGKYEQQKNILEWVSADKEVYLQHLQRGKDNVKLNPLSLYGYQGTDVEHIALYLNQVHKEYVPDGKGDRSLGTLYGFELFIGCKIPSERDRFFNNALPFNYFYAKREGSEVKYTTHNGQPFEDSATLTAKIFLNAIDKTTDLAEKYSREVERFEDRMGVLKNLLKKTFPQQEELNEMKKELQILSAKIMDGIQERKSTEEPVEVAPVEKPVVPMVADMEIDIGKIIPINGEDEHVGRRISRRV
ncbi:helicase-related protein [Olivibacter domesticus]|uniref:Adenine-specific DNA methylase, N12 class n=1 Tax=Olivibacter domesticus TaxID=407022 RepID=A0A1H7I9U5_OLID1|nr:helicase-related protein [Olivibacter domesticus]SEK59266.1 Adenine-specific DNA methylase, N12 class [Olivibacter domesticus]